ncbi:polyketide synthase docking domain-containing protein, partial [Streptomyces sp. NPDC005784]|uniref:polyketide synthase docking domain-containing protein n=1 Tax=Streptomyces sp. NPDC005784 TaxID=3364731 RepID=UPI0036B52CA6
MVNEEKYLDYLKRATTDLREARRRLREVEEREQEPIAVVAMSCRYPGGGGTPPPPGGGGAGGGGAAPPPPPPPGRGGGPRPAPRPPAGPDADA